MGKIVAAVACLALGFVSIGSSFVWDNVMDESGSWSKEDASQSVKSMGNLHAQINALGEAKRRGEDTREIEEKLVEVREQRHATSEKLRRAKAFRHNGRVILRYGGCALLIVGAVIFLVSRQEGAA